MNIIIILHNTLRMYTFA